GTALHRLRTRKGVRMQRRIATRIGGSAAVAALSLGGAWLWAAVPATAAPTTKTFEFTGKAETFVVPANVCRVTIDAFGAAGGNGINENFPDSGVGALGGHATAAIQVTPGETLQVNVGGHGGDGAEPLNGLSV